MQWKLIKKQAKFKILGEESTHWTPAIFPSLYFNKNLTLFNTSETHPLSNDGHPLQRLSSKKSEAFNREAEKRNFPFSCLSGLCLSGLNSSSKTIWLVCLCAAGDSCALKVIQRISWNERSVRTNNIIVTSIMTSACVNFCSLMVNFLCVGIFD